MSEVQESRENEKRRQEDGLISSGSKRKNIWTETRVVQESRERERKEDKRRV